jgi:N-acyl-D-amino-acid deacylase
VTRIAIVGAEVVDGSGSPPKLQTVLVVDDTIIDLLPADLSVGGDFEVIDMPGLTLTPGFVDVHSHADNAPFLEDDDLSKVMQGVTTEIMGNCGFSLAPRKLPNEGVFDSYATRIFPPMSYQWNSFGEMLEAADQRGYVTNYAPMLGHHTVRIAAMGMNDSEARDDDLDLMKRLVDEAVEGGIVGFSTGLIYPPGVFATSDEIQALVSQIPPGVVYATHMRGEGAQVFASISEALDVGRRTGRRVQISHLKTAGRYNWGKMPQAMDLIREARESGVDVRQDIYPYTAGSTMLTACLPPWFQEGGNAGVLARLHDPGALAQLAKDLGEISLKWENMVIGAGWEGIVVSSTADHRFEGQSLATIANELGIDPLEALRHVLVEEQLQATMTVHQMSEDDVVTALEDGLTMIGSDGLPPGTGGKPHPRMYGTFPRILSRFSRELQVLSMPEAVRRMTSLPADTFGLKDRGLIRKGMKADLVAIDAGAVTDVATFADPIQYPIGIPWVLVNGHVVVKQSGYVDGRHGTRISRGA